MKPWWDTVLEVAEVEMTEVTEHAHVITIIIIGNLMFQCQIIGQKTSTISISVPLFTSSLCSSV